MLNDIKTKHDEHRLQLDGTESLTVQKENVDKPNMCFKLCLVLRFVAGIFLIFYGAIYINDCPAKKMLPISLIVVGSLVILLRVVNCPYDFQKIFNSRTTPMNPIVAVITILIWITHLGWYMSMCYWSLSLQPDTIPEHRDAANYCQSEFHLSVYWGSIGGLIFLGVMLIRCCISCCPACIKISNDFLNTLIIETCFENKKTLL